MSREIEDISKAAMGRRLPLRDWVLLPAVGLLTILLLSLLIEGTARILFPSSSIGLSTCMSSYNPATGTRPIPNSVCWEKRPEGRYTAEYRFNSCGHRAGMECGPKPAGAYRIVMAGSSFAMGSGVPREMTFAALLPIELSRRTGRNVQLYNEAKGFGFPARCADLDFDAVLAAQPDLILWILTPSDIQDTDIIPSVEEPANGDVASARKQRAGLEGAAFRLLARYTHKLHTASGLAHAWWDETSAAIMFNHLVFANRSPSQYVDSFLRGGDISTGFLKENPSATWNDRLRRFDGYAADMEARAEAAGVPLVAVLIPVRAQAIMLASGKWPAGYDPYKLDAELKARVTSHGGTYIDILPEFRAVPHPEKYYMLVDGHPDGPGHAMIAGMIAKELMCCSVPALADRSSSSPALQVGDRETLKNTPWKISKVERP